MDITEFPMCLRNHMFDNEPGTAAQFLRSNNLVIMEWAKNPDSPSITRSERAILSLASGIHRFVMSNKHIGTTGQGNDYYATEIVESLCSAFVDALNYDLGRLDGAILSEWVCTLHKATTGEDM